MREKTQPLVLPNAASEDVRLQNVDDANVAYRPDGVRFAYDSKTLNTRKSLAKNYQNMINDLGTEAATVHTRFPSAIVAFIVAVPKPCLGNHRANLTNALKRLSARGAANAEVHKAEVISLVVWDPVNGQVDPTWPQEESPLRIDSFLAQVEACYLDRFAGLPPHV